jgi:uncharacterized protein
MAEAAARFNQEDAMRIIPADLYRRMPWKNGGGETTEIAIAPAGASLNDFNWRISMARIDSAGPFSTFPAVDRTLSVIAGEGLDLTFADGRVAHLDRDSAPFVFAADAPVEATLVGGPIKDLNVMTRRGLFRHRVAHFRANDTLALPVRSEIMLVLVDGALATFRTPQGTADVATGDTVWLAESEADSVEVIPKGAVKLYVVDIWPADLPPRATG